MNEPCVTTCLDANRFEAMKPSALNRLEKEAVIRLALSVLAERHRAGRVLGNPADTRSYLQLKLSDYRNEVFGVVFLTNQHRIIRLVELFQGTIDSAAVYPRVVVQQALEMNAAAVILFHNHPSGIAEPSRADESLTRRLREALALIDVRVLDHLVVGLSESVSFAEKGLL